MPPIKLDKDSPIFSAVVITGEAHISVKDQEEMDKTNATPEWLLQLKEKGYKPYIATSRKLLPFLNIKPFGEDASLYLMDDMEDQSFLQAYFLLEAYLLSNSLGFESPGLKMPHWVLIDCVLMQTAVVGFTMPKGALPDELLDFYRADEKISFEKLEHIPISGQISATNIDQQSMTGISLFSLGRRWLKDDQKIGLYTKTLAMEVYDAKKYGAYYGIAQYDNMSLKIHGRFTREMEIDQSMVPLHPSKDMTFIYKMKLDYDAHNPGRTLPDIEPTFWLNAHDTAKKREIQKGMRSGKRYIIAPPFIEKRDGGIFLPIVEKDAA